MAKYKLAISIPTYERPNCIKEIADYISGIIAIRELVRPFLRFCYHRKERFYKKSQLNKELLFEQS